MRHSVARTGVGGGPLRSESARLPGVTLALAAPGPPVQLRWTTLRVQGPTLRDAALANDGDGSPPVAPRLLPQPRPGSSLLRCDRYLGGGRPVGAPAKWSCHFAGSQWAPLERIRAVGILVAGRELVEGSGQPQAGARDLRSNHGPTEPRSEGEPLATAAAKSRSLKVTNTPSGHA